jgi:pyruvate dehydrogenase E2 component (dihydrolipoamide acetyltransferase)
MQSIPLSGMRKAIAQKMLESHRQIPMVTLQSKADVSELLDIKTRLNKARPDKFTLTDFVVKACAMALKRHPNMNVRLSESGFEIIRIESIDIGIAVAMDDGLLVPVVRSADRLSLSRLAAASRNLVTRARGGKLAYEELSGGSFTVSNLGMYGVISFNPIINLPESAILGVGAIESVLALQDGNVIERKTMGLSLTVDHRTIDGAPAAIFLKTIKGLIEQPYALMAD